MRSIPIPVQRPAIIALLPIKISDVNIPLRLQRIQHILLRRNRFILFRRIRLIRWLLLRLLGRGLLRSSRRLCPHHYWIANQS